MHTEEQAKELWCPEVRFSDPQPKLESANRWPIKDSSYGTMINPKACHCIASKCAMWRWDEMRRNEGHSNLGYCGLAGKP
jgi:hypothetical protein